MERMCDRAKPRPTHLHTCGPPKHPRQSLLVLLPWQAHHHALLLPQTTAGHASDVSVMDMYLMGLEARAGMEQGRDLCLD